ncbi:SGNH/GDSL hydrolase family protein [Agromyces italicus]|uniref:SGNH/GDSL hydrolase family protein n=1 Tax=Agromyces italicus TaxID=279572 RepID=UPI0003B70062|nr:SGNH/GDSL hydrolase family protein [Agromyces italicus]
MSALSTRKARHGIVAAAAAVALLAIPIGIALPAQAAPPQTSVAKYVALGDSLAAGQGTGTPLDACLRTGAGYANGLDALPRINLLRNPGCSGASIGDVADSQLGQVNRGTTLVTITAGAGDLDVGAVYAACAPDPTSPSCEFAYGQALSTLQSGVIGERLATLIAAVSERSPRTDILVTGYPLPFDDVVPGLPQQINDAVGLLNANIAGAVASLAQAVPVGYVDVTEAFADHGAGSADPWLGQNPGDPITFLHPNAAGYAAYTNVVHAAYLVAVAS